MILIGLSGSQKVGRSKMKYVVYALAIVSLFTLCAWHGLDGESAVGMEQSTLKDERSDDEIIEALNQNDGTDSIILVDEQGETLDFSPSMESYEEQITYFRSYFETSDQKAILLDGKSEACEEAETFTAVRSVTVDVFGNAKIKGGLFTIDEKVQSGDFKFIANEKYAPNEVSAVFESAVNRLAFEP
jgi:hypothetical protein